MIVEYNTCKSVYDNCVVDVIPECNKKPQYWQPTLVIFTKLAKVTQFLGAFNVSVFI
ncbi:hypothetical protein H1P_2040008 [Hyella patelloides LEGE 07179]|uniref:Uncharacterized protein n=1 Tax=Hyella patelloides LEGE 07179 TaxID=945734 RepID=A0A563VQ96_9CYAN|nr:hypothetical protein H1P_2040008 [Hyella patelloides LEGE 07179]